MKKRATRLFIAFIVTAFTVPFITYDTGIRCIAPPCVESAARGGLIEFFSKSYNFNAYIIDWWVFFGVFIGLYIFIELLNKWAEF